MLRSTVLRPSAWVAVGTLAFSGVAAAASDGGFYAALATGNADSDGTTAAFAVDDGDLGLVALLGFALLPSVAIEAGYADFGEVDALGPAGGISVETDGFLLGLRAQLPIGADVFVQGRAGAFLWDVATRTTLPVGPTVGGDDDGVAAYYGLGARWDFAEAWGASVDYTHHETSAFDVDFLAATLYYRFDF